MKGIARNKSGAVSGGGGGGGVYSKAGARTSEGSRHVQGIKIQGLQVSTVASELPRIW